MCIEIPDLLDHMYGNTCTYIPDIITIVGYIYVHDTLSDIAR